MEASRVTIRVWDGVIDVEDMRLSLPSVLGMICFCTLTAGVAYWLSSNRRGRDRDGTCRHEADDIDRVRSGGFFLPSSSLICI